MYDDEEMLPLSALAQWYYCRRRAGLTLLEQQWKDNVYTAEGSILHQRVHTDGDEARCDVRTCRRVRLRSSRLGLSGMADCVELRLTEAPEGNAIKLDGVEGFWIPVPIEYKHGRKRDELEYEVQLCAEAMCMEEMLDISVRQGYLYYEESRRRQEVIISVDLRTLVERGSMELHEMCRLGNTPRAEFSSKCVKCSVRELCWPDLSKTKPRQYLAKMLAEMGRSDG